MNRSTTCALMCALSVLVTLPAAAQVALTPAQTFADPGVLTDGLAVGDVHPNAGDEVVVIAEGTTWNTDPPNPGTGRAYVLDSDLNLLTTFQPSEANRELIGAAKSCLPEEVAVQSLALCCWRSPAPP